MLFVPFLVLCLDSSDCAMYTKNEPLPYEECMKLLEEDVNKLYLIDPKMTIGGLCVPLGGEPT